MTPNPNENQAEKHSAEPWMLVETHGGMRIEVHDSEGKVIISGYFDFDISGNVQLAKQFKANAERFVACLNFCAGVLNSDLNEDSIAHANARLADAQIEVIGLRKELEKDFETRTLAIVSERDSLTAELSTLRKELEAAKKVKEWLTLHSPILLKALQSYIGNPCETAYELRELLNNGKDGE